MFCKKRVFRPFTFLASFLPHCLIYFLLNFLFLVAVRFFLDLDFDASAMDWVQLVMELPVYFLPVPLTLFFAQLMTGAEEDPQVVLRLKKRSRILKLGWQKVFTVSLFLSFLFLTSLCISGSLFSSVFCNWSEVGSYFFRENGFVCSTPPSVLVLYYFFKFFSRILSFSLLVYGISQWTGKIFSLVVGILFAAILTWERNLLNLFPSLYAANLEKTQLILPEVELLVLGIFLLIVLSSFFLGWIKSKKKDFLSHEK